MRGGSLLCQPTAPSYIEDAECSATDRTHKGGARAPSALSPIPKEPSLSTGSFDGCGAFLSGGSLLCPPTAPSYIEGAEGSTADRDHTGGARAPGLLSTIPNGPSLSIGSLDGGGAFLRGGSILCSPTAPSYVDEEGNNVSPREQHEEAGAAIDMITIFVSGIAAGRTRTLSAMLAWSEYGTKRALTSAFGPAGVSLWLSCSTTRVPELVTLHEASLCERGTLRIRVRTFGGFRQPTAPFCVYPPTPAAVRRRRSRQPLLLLESPPMLRLAQVAILTRGTSEPEAWRRIYPPLREVAAGLRAAGSAAVTSGGMDAERSPSAALAGTAPAGAGKRLQLASSR